MSGRSGTRRPSRSSVSLIRKLGTVLAVTCLGWLAVEQLWNRPERQSTASGGQYRLNMPMCADDRYTCVVDGDTIWLEGRNLRLQSFDTPEPHDGICGGQTEVELAMRASARLSQLLSSNAFDVEIFGPDGTGQRTLADVSIGGGDVGNILIEEGLARSWPDGEEWWCR